MDSVKRNKALRVLKHLSVVQLFVTTILLILGGVSSSQHGERAPGVPPYYLGVFIVGPVAILTAILGMAIYFKGRHCYNKIMAAEKIGCLMRTYCISIPFNWLSSFITVLIAALTGICTTSDCSYLEHTGRNYRLAITIVILVLLVFVSDVFGLVLICIYANNFGLRLLSRGQYRIAVSDVRQPTVYVTNDNLISSFQLQNQILQNQVNLNSIQTRQNHILQTEMQLNEIQDRRPGHANRHPSRGQSIENPLDSVVHQAWTDEINDTSPRIQPRQIANSTQNRPNQNIQWENELSEFQHHTIVEGQYQQTRPGAGNNRTSHRKKRKRRRIKPSHPQHDGQGPSYVLPPLVSHSVPPPPPSPPPPPNTPPPELSDDDSEDPPPYYINVDIKYVSKDPPPPYTP